VGADHGRELAYLLSRGAPSTPDRDTLDLWGRAVGAVLERPAVVTLEGDLGAGLGVVDLQAVTSPTFSLVQQYAAPAGAVVHVDLYRLRSDAELEALGWDELVATSSVLLVEWPERALATLPAHTIRITLAHDNADPARRRLKVIAPVLP
jgi:tRNA threonylcarbamoyl adenosine modification protein YjeE